MERYEGFLTKQGSFRKSWKQRWFVLEHGTLKYFKSHTGTKPLGRIQVKNNTCGGGSNHILKQTHCIEIKTELRVYFMYASSEQEFELWKQKIISNGGIWDDNLLTLLSDPSKGNYGLFGSPKHSHSVKKVQNVEQSNGNDQTQAIMQDGDQNNFSSKCWFPSLNRYQAEKK